MARRGKVKRKGIAWTEITLRPTIDNKTGAVLQKSSVKAGSEVTPESLGIGDAEWDILVAEKIIRSKPYPSNIKRHEAPKNALLRHARELAAEAASGGTSDDMYDYDDNTEPEDDDKDDDETDPNKLQDGESEEDRLVRLGMV